MKTTKIFALAIALLMGFALAACSDSGSNNSGGSTNTPPSSQGSTSDPSQSGTSDTSQQGGGTTGVLCSDGNHRWDLTYFDESGNEILNFQVQRVPNDEMPYYLTDYLEIIESEYGVLPTSWTVICSDCGEDYQNPRLPQAQELVSELKIGIGGRYEQGQEIAMRITIPELPDRLAALELEPGTFSTIEIHFGNGYFKPITIYGSAASWYTHNNGYDPMKIDGDSVLLIFFMPEQYSADDIGDVEVVGFTASDLEQGGQSFITFSNNDIMVPYNELVPYTKISEFGFDPTAITLSATNNGDGTMSFVYKDTSIKPIYIMPWEWIESLSEIGHSRAMFFAYWTITGVDIYGEPRVGGLIPLQSDLGYGDFNYETWDLLTLELDLEKDMRIKGDPEDMRITVDETGLTAVWTESFLPGYGFDDIVAFLVVAEIGMHSYTHDPNDSTFISIYEGLSFEVADVVE